MDSSNPFILLQWFAGRHRLLDPRTQDVRGAAQAAGEVAGDLSAGARG
ncbi:hypothetical protein [Streptomyces sp. SLBN-8D4]